MLDYEPLLYKYPSFVRRSENLHPTNHSSSTIVFDLCGIRENHIDLRLKQINKWVDFENYGQVLFIRAPPYTLPTLEDHFNLLDVNKEIAFTYSISRGINS